MNIALENFTPISSAIGGALLGISAVILMAFNGRIAGISGIFSGAVFSSDGGKPWRLMFVAGMLLAPIIHLAVNGGWPEFEITTNWFLLIAGGLLVGYGTRLGSGCTSGHGICGLARFSIRSLVAVLAFMSGGIAAVAVMKKVLGM